MAESREAFRAVSSAEDGKGRMVENVCLGCDHFFQHQVGPELRRLRDERLASKVQA